MSKPKLSKNITVPQDFLMSLLTPSEIRMLKNRYSIIKLLEEGLSVRKIAEQVRVGTDTVVRVARMMEKTGLKKGSSSVRKKTNTPWIFGKSS